MSKYKFTPGPWKADEDNWVRNSEGVLLASVTKEWKSKEEIFATRDLISAAPELFKALERARIFFSAVPDENMPDGLLKDVETALSKARGQSNG